jgi:hypothetical protein
MLWVLQEQPSRSTKMADPLSFTFKFPFKSASGDTITTRPITRLIRKDITAAQTTTKDEGGARHPLEQ